MANKVFISIITVVFNGEKTIERTIQSILNQQFLNYEYLIQDGCSNDNTVEVAKSYEEQFNGRMHIFSETDNGIYDAMNKGISRASGQYIWLVNSDDYITPNALQDFYDYCVANDFPEALISNRMNVVDNMTNKVYATTKVLDLSSFERDCSKLKMGICHPATIVHKDIYKKIGGYDDRYYISADLDFAIRCYRESVQVLFTELVLTNMTDGGISNQLPIMKCMHDCNIRAEKFCPNMISRIKFKIWYLLRLIVVKFRGYRYN